MGLILVMIFVMPCFATSADQLTCVDYRQTIQSVASESNQHHNKSAIAPDCANSAHCGLCFSLLPAAITLIAQSADPIAIITPRGTWPSLTPMPELQPPRIDL